MKTRQNLIRVIAGFITVMLVLEQAPLMDVLADDIVEESEKESEMVIDEEDNDGTDEEFPNDSVNSNSAEEADSNESDMDDCDVDYESSPEEVYVSAEAEESECDAPDEENVHDENCANNNEEVSESNTYADDSEFEIEEVLIEEDVIEIEEDWTVELNETADQDWYKKYNYVVDNEKSTIILTKYTGKYEDNIIVPSYAVVGGLEYTVVLSGNVYSGADISSISFSNGVMFSDDMTELFQGCRDLEKVDLRGVDSHDTVSMECMFLECPLLTEVKLNGIDTSNVENMSGMFEMCSALTSVDLSGLDTSKVKSMWAMFSRCENLTDLNIQDMNTSNVENMHSMFAYCTKLQSLDLSNFDMSSAIDLTESRGEDGFIKYVSPEQIKTPMNLSYDIPLDTVYVDDAGNEYITLPKLSKSITIRKRSSDDLTGIVANSIEVGDYIYFGKYKNELIRWRCISIDENGPLMLSEKVLCLKEYDAASPLYSNYYRKTNGSNFWNTSCLRQWLNSNSKTVDWIYGTPSYGNEAGFMTNFTSEELSSINVVTQRTYLNSLDADLKDGGSKELDLQCGTFENDLKGLSSRANDCIYIDSDDSFFCLGAEQLDALYANFGADFTKAYPSVELAKSSGISAESYREYWVRIPANWGMSYENNVTIRECDNTGIQHSNTMVGVRPAFYLKVGNSVAPVDTNIDENKYIVEEVGKYTNEVMWQAYSNIMNENSSMDEKMRKLNLLFQYYGITDIREGVDYISDVTSYHRNYLYLTTDENYSANNFYDWIFSDSPDGTAARASLVTQSLLFNGDVWAYTDITTYAKGDLPMVERNKEVLREIILSDIEQKNNEIEDIMDNSKDVSDFLGKAAKVNGIQNDEYLNGVLKNFQKANNAGNVADIEKYGNEYWEYINKHAKFETFTTSDGIECKRMYLPGDRLIEAVGKSGKIVNVVVTGMDDLKAFGEVETNLELYYQHRKFLQNISECTYIDVNLRLAAQQLIDEMDAGYLSPIKELLFDTFDFMDLDTDIVKFAFNQVGMESFAATYGEAAAVVKFSVFVSNIVIDAGAFSKEAWHTCIYACLGTLYSDILEDDKWAFKEKPTSENAWRFFEDYTFLWTIRYLGEEQSLKLSTVKIFLVECKARGYHDKEKVVDSIKSCLEQCRFHIAPGVVIPPSVQYKKKAVFNCPVDIYVYDTAGNIITIMQDGMDSDITNEYGRFVVLYQPYTGEYSKIICQSTDEELTFKAVAIDMGYVDFQSYDGETLKAADKIVVEKADAIIMQDADGYSIERATGDVDVYEMVVRNDDEYIPVEELSVLNDEMTIKEGERQVISCVVYPNNASNTILNWVSQDEEIVTVENGVIYGISEGTAIVDVYAVDGEGIYKAIKVNVCADRAFLLCDVNNDEKVNAADRIYLARYLAGWSGYLLQNEAAADVNKDNKVNAADRIYLARYLAGWSGYSLG